MSFFKIILVLFLPLFIFSINYDVKFTGVKDKELRSRLEDSSDLVMLKNRPPYSINALSYRAKNDIQDLYKVLRSQGYYDAKISFKITEEKDALVTITVNLGPRYILSKYKIYQNAMVKCHPISPKSLGITQNRPIDWETIIDAELGILDKLSSCGYPLSSIEKREVIVDMLTKTIRVEEYVDNGPLSRYGQISIMGLKTVRPEVVLNKLLWEEGDIYSSEQLERAQQKLIQSELFSSVLITHDEILNEEGKLAMKMHVEEAKHKSFGFGVTYATIDGPGGTLSWTNRNFRGLGERLLLEVDVSKIASIGVASYTKPDFLIRDQDFIAQANVVRENVVPFLSFTYRGGLRLDRQFNPRLFLSYGVKGEFITVRESNDNGDFTLVAPPVFVRYSTANSLLNPTEGFSTGYKVTPYFSVGDNKSFFLKQTLIANYYLPTSKSQWLVLAFRSQIGSIAFAPLSKIPFNKRFLGGSDDDLRGYRFQTVSPNDNAGNPKGARSQIYFTFEPRFRVTETIGIVPFTDWGTLSENVYPDPAQKWFKSAGIGLRYFTFFGPLRADLAFPLNKRKRDPNYRVYISIGQTF